MCHFHRPPVCLASHSCRTHEGQKRMSDALELELQEVASHCVSTGTWTQVFCKSSVCSSLSCHLSYSWLLLLLWQNTGKMKFKGERVYSALWSECPVHYDVWPVWISPQLDLSTLNSHWVDQEAETGLEDTAGIFESHLTPMTCFLQQGPVSLKLQNLLKQCRPSWGLSIHLSELIRYISKPNLQHFQPLEMQFGIWTSDRASLTC